MATIHAFPATSISGERRLAVALNRLERSVRAQQLAFAEWRAHLAKLDAAVGGLKDGLRRYEAGLAGAASGLDAAARLSRDTAALMAQAS